MKKYSKIIIAVFFVLFMAPAIICAANAKATTGQTKVAENQQSQVDNLKARANKEIDRRTATLNKLITKVDKLEKLSSVQKTDIKSQIQQNLDDLAALKIKIAGETELSALKADVQSIKDSYRIYLLFVPKVHLLSGAYVATDTITKLEEIYTKLETKITDAKTAGKNVSTLETTLSDMKSKIAEAKTNIAVVEATVMPLEPSGYPANKTELQKARVSLRNAHSAIVAARKDTKTIVNGLKALEKPAAE